MTRKKPGVYLWTPEVKNCHRCDSTEFESNGMTCSYFCPRCNVTIPPPTKVVLVEANGNVFDVLGKNDFIGTLNDVDFQDGWGERLPVEYNP